MVEMTSKERMRRAMNLEEPDRVPVMCQMSAGHMLLQTGFSPSEFWFSAELFADALLELRKVYCFDGILISLHGHSPYWTRNIVKIQAEEKGEIVYWKSGDKTVFPYDDLPRHYPAEEPCRLSISEFDPASILEEIDFIPVSRNLEYHLDHERRYGIFDIIHEKAGNLYSIHGEVPSPFDYFLNLFGLEDGMTHLIQNAQKSREILQRFTEGVNKIAEEQAKHGVDAIKISSPYAGGAFISPAFYREFILPYEGQIARAVHACGIPVYTHTCGPINDRLEMMVEAGISGLECLDPPPLGNVSLAEAKKRVGEKVFIKGNIDPVNVLLLGTLETIKEDAKHRIEAGKPGGGFILSTACSIAPHTKKENIQILAKAAEEEGYYRSNR